MAYPYPQAAGGQLPFVLNPPVPYVSQIYGGAMSPGRMIFIQGFVPAGADRFHINLQCGTSTNPRADIALHFNPRFGANVCVRNTLKGQKWGAEERGQSHFPFAFNQNFEIIILCEANQFKVAVNGQHFIEYNHRVKNLKRIDTIAIDGKVHIHSIRYQGESAGYKHGAGSIVNPPMPYTGPVVGGMTPGRLIFLSGKVRANPDRFHVNLQCGVGQNPRPDIGFHFNPRFQAQTVVRNTLQRQSWGNEERNASYFPFAPNGFFEMIILCEAQGFKVAVNGQHFLEYAHRLPCQNINTLVIDGAVDIHQIRFQ
uniref:Galectin n=1 Tax=Paracentrotus lividus TaxID=7656 RepID=A0A0U5C3R9_PARLI|nr:GALECTIN-8 protein [Paracentrotus lividus]